MFKVVIFLILTLTLLISEEIRLGVVPQQSPLKLLKVWKPIATYLSQTTGHKVVFHTEKTIPRFAQALKRGDYDIAYVSPTQFVMAHSSAGYNATVRAKKNIQGIILAKKGSSLKKLLQSHPTLLFPSPGAFAATLLVKYELVGMFGVDFTKDVKVRYVNSHDSVYKGIARGVGHLGGGIVRTFNVFNDVSSKEKIEIVHRTKAYPSHPFVVHPRLNETIQKSLTKAFLAMPDSLKKTLKIRTFVSITNSEYDSVAKLLATIQHEQ